MKKPMLLSPCGSPGALRAAVAAGADECYFGGSAANARMNAKGFTEEEFRGSLELLRLHGIRSNITLNTVLYDREMDETVEFAKRAVAAGADAFIVQDLGLAKRLREEIPRVELHASTQCACHNLEGAKALAQLGFSRVVLARELPLSDIEKITAYGLATGLFETEVFLHGALCVCHSGMCLMSSHVGGRSGNRGLCAQPCRMMGSLENASGKKVGGVYPLSLRDLSLARHIEKLSSVGVASLKIEGRMKSPEYVYCVTKAYRNLIDEKKNATLAQEKKLSEVFSRGGFTDGYFTNAYKSDNREMYGYRSEADKKSTREAEINVAEIPKIPAEVRVSIKRGEAPCCAISACGRQGEHRLEKPPATAQNAPLTRESVMKNITKFGGTEFYAQNVEISLDEGLFLSASDINELRRRALKNLILQINMPKNGVFCDKKEQIFAKREKKNAVKLRIFTENCSFLQDKNRYPEEIESICLPLSVFANEKKFTPPKYKFGVQLPEVIFEEEIPFVKKCLERAATAGAYYVYLSNIGHISLARETGLLLFGGAGLNITNSEALSEYTKMGFYSLCVSSELKMPQIRDLRSDNGASLAVCAYGRLPLMVLESCILRARGLCCGNSCSICGEYTDRIGKKFKILSRRRFIEGEGLPCRNIILNADVLRLYDRKDKLSAANADIWEIYDNE